MNSASKDFPKHLGILRERMLHPTDYETALHYFLEEFGGDEQFVAQSDPDTTTTLPAILARVISSAMGRQVKFDVMKMFLLAEHRFFHGNAAVEGRVVLFFYFKDANTGIAALIPGVNGPMEVARFRMPGGLTEPGLN